MSFLSRLLGTEPDPREALRPLWHRAVTLARTAEFYSECLVADTVAGRFDMITAVTACVMVRLETSEMRTESALFAELFVEDMEGQMRELGVNDVVVGKRMGKVMSSLGGRLGAYRPALNNRDLEALTSAVERNITFNDGGSPQCAATKLLSLMDDLSALSDDDLLAAKTTA
ncbi:ubiquinol-cytochrome C chaperone family protein [Altererythrobacter sp. GH1-8]|uniref:ubiquinol-cytochrome C chaperone family protein n=1 Tax=Altererythrobacter sp. GH1-8 TaxID=3349333 RepID=UPI00374C953A